MKNTVRFAIFNIGLLLAVKFGVSTFNPSVTWAKAFVMWLLIITIIYAVKSLQHRRRVAKITAAIQ